MKKLIKLLVLGGIIAAIVKLVQSKKAEWEGLTETEVRSKLDSKLSPKMPPEKLEKIQDNVVGVMRARGKLREEPTLESVDDLGDSGVETG